MENKRLLATCRDVDPEEIVKVKQRLSALEHEVNECKSDVP